MFARSSPDPRDGFRVVDPISTYDETDDCSARSRRRTTCRGQHSPVPSEVRFATSGHTTHDIGRARTVDRYPATTSYSTRCRVYPRAGTGRAGDCSEQERRGYRGARGVGITKATQTPDWWNEREVVYLTRSPREGQTNARESTSERPQSGGYTIERRTRPPNSRLGYSSNLAVGDFQFVIRADDAGALVPAKDLLALRRVSLRAGTAETDHDEDAGLAGPSFVAEDEYERSPSGLNEWEGGDADQEGQDQSAVSQEEGWTAEQAAASPDGSWADYDDERGYERAEEDHPLSRTHREHQLEGQETDVTDLDPDYDEGAAVVLDETEEEAGG